MGRMQIKEIVTNHQLKVNRKLKEALTRGWIEWSTQAVELQIFRADTENQKKEGHGFYKIDENNVQILREDLNKEFQALARTHTTVIGNLLQEFNDDQLLLMLETEAYECECTQAKKETEVAAQASLGRMTEEAA